jgi:hypothetical protein
VLDDDGLSAARFVSKRHASVSSAGMDAFLGAFARFCEQSLEDPLLFLSSLEARSGLGPDQFLALNLLVFLAYSTVAFSIIANVRKPGWHNRPLGFLAFYIWFIVGMGAECRAGVGSASGGVVDIGHQLLTPIHSWSIAEPAGARLAVTANSLYVMAIATLAAWHAFGLGRPRLLLTCIPSGCVRMILGVLTRMPMPEGFVPTPGDWPPPSPNCQGFVLNPSGHVMQATMGCIYLFRIGHKRSAVVASVLNVGQAVWLVAVRGHYTADVLTALLLCAAVEPLFGKVAREER